MKINLYFLKLLITNCVLFVFLILCINIFGQTNRGIVLNGGLLVNKTISNTLIVNNYNNDCIGGTTFSFELGAKLKFSKYFSTEFGYQNLKQHIRSDFKNLEVYDANNFSHTGYIYILVI